MHAWAALKPADIVQAARACRDMVKGVKDEDGAPDARPAESPPVGQAPAGDSAPAE